MIVPTRSYSSNSYRYGFQTQEKDDEIKGEGNSINYKFRMHDPRVGRFFAVDPLTAKYPWNSSYAFSENRVFDGVELEGLEFDSYLKRLLKQGTQFVVEKATDIALDYAERAAVEVIKSIPKYINKKINEQTVVVDFSVSKEKTIISAKGVSLNVVVVGGVSGTYNIGGDNIKNGVFPHIGIGLSVGAGPTDGILNFPSLSGSIGLVGGNFNEAFDYSGAFADYSGNICGFGASYCYWPDGANATSLTIDGTALAETILTDTPNASAAARIDWYFMIPEKDNPDTSWESQFNNLSTFLKGVFKGDDEGFNQVIEDVKNVFNQLKEKTDDEE